MTIEDTFAPNPRYQAPLNVDLRQWRSRIGDAYETISRQLWITNPALSHALRRMASHLLADPEFDDWTFAGVVDALNVDASWAGMTGAERAVFCRINDIMMAWDDSFHVFGPDEEGPHDAVAGMWRDTLFLRIDAFVRAVA